MVVYLVIFFPLSFIGNFRYYRVLSVVIATIYHTILLFDIKIYLMVKVHLGVTALNLIVRELDFDTGLHYNFLMIAIPIVIALELIFAKITTHSLYRYHHTYFVRSVIVALVSCFICSHLMHIWADAAKYERITLLRSSFPVHYPMTAKSFLTNHGFVSGDDVASEDPSNSADYLSYPLSKIAIDDQARPKNVITISFNGLSSANLSAENTPNLLAFKLKSNSFEDHYLLYKNELDNVFSLNYGMPLKYRRAMFSSDIIPVAVDEMYRQDYVRRLILSDVRLNLAKKVNKNTNAAAADNSVVMLEGNEGIVGEDGALIAGQEGSDSSLVGNSQVITPDSAYYRELLLNSAMRSPQLSVTANVKEIFTQALNQIALYQNHDQRPYALSLVVNDLREFRAQIAALHGMSAKQVSMALDNAAKQKILVAEAKAKALRAGNANEVNRSELKNAHAHNEQVHLQEEVLYDDDLMDEASLEAKKANHGKDVAQASNIDLAKEVMASSEQQLDLGDFADGSEAIAMPDSLKGNDGTKMHSVFEPLVADRYDAMEVAHYYEQLFELRSKQLLAKDVPFAKLKNQDPLVQDVLMYESTLRYVDGMFAAFIEGLSKSGMLKNTIVIVTSTEGNFMLSSAPHIYDRLIQHVPLMVYWPDENNDGVKITKLSSPLDISATYAHEVVNITTPSGNFGLGFNLRYLSNDRRHLVADQTDSIVLVGKQDNIIYDDDGASYIERNGERLQVRPNLEDLIEATRDLNRFVR